MNWLNEIDDALARQTDEKTRPVHSRTGDAGTIGTVREIAPREGGPTPVRHAAGTLVTGRPSARDSREVALVTPADANSGRGVLSTAGRSLREKKKEEDVTEFSPSVVPRSPSKKRELVVSKTKNNPVGFWKHLKDPNSCDYDLPLPHQRNERDDEKVFPTPNPSPASLLSTEIEIIDTPKIPLAIDEGKNPNDSDNSECSSFWEESSSSSSSSLDEEEINSSVWHDPSFPFIPERHNIHGVFQIDILKARDLPCLVGSSVGALTSLSPWKGQVAAPTTIAHADPWRLETVGCRWDENDEEGDEDSNVFSFLHAPNDRDAPVPRFDLVLVCGLFRSELCRFSMECEPLMTRPRAGRRRWFGGSDGPSVLVELRFEPTEDDVGNAESREGTAGVSSEVSVRTYSSRFVADPRNSHLFRTRTYWKPARCSICLRFLHKGFRCESCSLDSCDNCQLQANVRLPCGTPQCAGIVAGSVQSRWTVDSFLNVVAPVKEEETDGSDRGLNLDDAPDVVVSPKDVPVKAPPDGMGTLSLHIHTAHIFSTPFPPYASVSPPDDNNNNNNNNNKNSNSTDWKQGDHYVRMTSDNSERIRTPTVFQHGGRPNFDFLAEMTVEHPAQEFRLDLVDAHSDAIVGTFCFSAHGILHDQNRRSDDIQWTDVLPYRRKPHEDPPPRKAALEMRTGYPRGYTMEYCDPKRSDRGDVAASLNVSMSILRRGEDRNPPRPVPPRPAGPFNVAVLQLHISRINALFQTLVKFGTWAHRVTSWENVWDSALALVVFVYATLKFDIEYAASLIPLALIGFMAHGAMERRNGNFLGQWRNQGRHDLLESERTLSKSQSVHRPLATLQISIPRGRHLKSLELGLPLINISTGVSWCPLFYSTRQHQQQTAIGGGATHEYDACSAGSYPIGRTSKSGGLTHNPVWGGPVVEEEGLVRLKGRLPRFSEGGGGSDDKTIFELPILRPLSYPHGGRGEPSTPRPDRWDRSEGAVVCRLHVDKFHLFRDTLGSVIIPLSRLFREGGGVVSNDGECEYYLEGWFRVRSPTTEEADGNDVPISPSSIIPEEEDNTDPAIFVKVRLRLPPESSSVVSEADAESSGVVVEEMMRSVIPFGDNGGVADTGDRDAGLPGSSMIGNSVNTLYYVRTVGENVQNRLGMALDIVESVGNVFSWACPRTSSMVFCGLLMTWLVLRLVPTRVLILCGGMGQFIVNFCKRFGAGWRINKDDETLAETDPIQKSSDPPPLVVRATNLIRSIPTNEDFRRIYFWESQRRGETERLRLTKIRRAPRLNKLWKAVWYGPLQIGRGLHARDDVKPVAKHRRGKREWAPVFAVLQGHRLLWWDGGSERFDDGDAPSGEILFAGHSGLAGVSPLEMMELEEGEAPLVLSVFGRGRGGDQQKVMFMAETGETRDSIVDAVRRVTGDDKVH